MYVVTAKIAGLLGYLQPDGQFRLDRLTAEKFSRSVAEDVIAKLSLGTEVRLDMDPELPGY